MKMSQMMDVEFYNWIGRIQSKGTSLDGFLEHSLESPTMAKMLLFLFIEMNGEWTEKWVQDQILELKDNLATEESNASKG